MQLIVIQKSESIGGQGISVISGARAAACKRWRQTSHRAMYILRYWRFSSFSMKSSRLVTLLENSTADHTTVSLMKPVLRLSGDPSVVIDHRYIYTLKVTQLKDILQALRDAHGPCAQFRYFLDARVS